MKIFYFYDINRNKGVLYVYFLVCRSCKMRKNRNLHWKRGFLRSTGNMIIYGTLFYMHIYLHCPAVIAHMSTPAFFACTQTKTQFRASHNTKLGPSGKQAVRGCWESSLGLQITDRLTKVPFSGVYTQTHPHAYGPIMCIKRGAQ